MSFTCPDFYDEVTNAAERAGLVTSDDLPEDESGIAVMSDRICAVLRTPPSPKGLTEPQEAFLRGYFARVQYRSQSELGLEPPPRVSMSSDTFTMAVGALRGSENTVYRTLVRDGFLRNVGPYDFALTIKGRITVARLILPDARANFIELAKLANQEIV